MGRTAAITTDFESETKDQRAGSQQARCASPSRVRASVATPCRCLPTASKAALIHLTEQLALELSPRVRVNAIAPGVVRTKLAEALWKDQESQLNSAIALSRIGEPEDVGSAIAFLVSDAASWVTGETFVIDGGQRLGDAELFRKEAIAHA
ncbi:SDR family oxidoreductase [Nocardia sp. bgisy118]|uniref:SDR family oxidoreductase n=1 Tax=Nocardia sp. bgisy118 TaxID=3413786 RepID=UPI003F4A4146